MFVDGLWLSGITLEIDRSEMPIPESMKGEPLRVPLTRTQVNAITALLGLGVRGGDLLMYQDEDLDKLILDERWREKLRTEYEMLADGVKDNRRTVRIFTPLVEKTQDGTIPDDFMEGEDIFEDKSEGDAEEVKALSSEEMDALNFDRIAKGSFMPEIPKSEEEDS